MAHRGYLVNVIAICTSLSSVHVFFPIKSHIQFVVQAVCDEQYIRVLF